MRCSGDQHGFAPGASLCDCRQTKSTLANGGLPYPYWTLDPSSHRGTRQGSYALATDPHTGRGYLVHEYLPDPVPDALAQRRRFITVAKSLRSCPLPSHRIVFAYTRNQRCYTVAEPIPGTPLSSLTHMGGTHETECLARLEALLAGLQEMHAAGGAAGPLFHGDLRPEAICATGSGPSASLYLLHSLCLSNQLRETPLPPEHFQQRDLAAAADIALALAQGFATPGDKAARLGRIADPVLGATLEYLYGAHGSRAPTAKVALSYLHLLQRAAVGPDRTLLEQARAISPSPRLARPVTPVAAPPAPPPQPAQPRPVPSQPRPAAAPPVPAAPVQAPPPFVPYTPVAVPGRPGGQPVRRPAPQRRIGGCGGCLLTLMFALLVAIAVVAVLSRRPLAPATLDFSADPNPAPRKAHVQLQWTSSGFDRLELDGKRVRANGSMVITANTSHRYTLAGTRPDGSRVIREVDLSVLPRRPGKPARGPAGTPSVAPPSTDDSPEGIALPGPTPYPPEGGYRQAPSTDGASRRAEPNAAPI